MCGHLIGTMTSPAQYWLERVKEGMTPFGSVWPGLDRRVFPLQFLGNVFPLLTATVVTKSYYKKGRLLQLHSGPAVFLGDPSEEKAGLCEDIWWAGSLSSPHSGTDPSEGSGSSCTPTLTCVCCLLWSFGDSTLCLLSDAADRLGNSSASWGKHTISFLQWGEQLSLTHNSAQSTHISTSLPWKFQLYFTLRTCFDHSSNTLAQVQRDCCPGPRYCRSPQNWPYFLNMSLSKHLFFKRLMFFSRETQKSKISRFKHFGAYAKQGIKQTEAISFLRTI